MTFTRDLEGEQERSRSHGKIPFFGLNWHQAIIWLN